AAPGGPVRREQRVLDAAIEQCRGATEPDVGLGIDPLEAEAIEDFLAAHVEPADVDVGAPPLELMLQQGELVAAVGRVEQERSARVPDAARERDSQRGEQEPTRRRGPGQRGEDAASARRLANRRYAPGTPAGSWRKKLSPV